jgi:hypothetical protein
MGTSTVTDLSQLPIAESRQVTLYQPYFPQESKRRYLPYALSLFRQGLLEGERSIEGGENIAFFATWSVSNSMLPAEISRCQVRFENDSELTYELQLTNQEWVEYLIEVLASYQRERRVDFTSGFYRRLLRWEN